MRTEQIFAWRKLHFFMRVRLMKNDTTRPVEPEYLVSTLISMVAVGLGNLVGWVLIVTNKHRGNNLNDAD